MEGRGRGEGRRGEGRRGEGKGGEETLRFCPPYLNFLATPLIMSNHKCGRIKLYIKYVALKYSSNFLNVS